MPTYTFKNTNTGEEWTEQMTISARTQYLADNPHIEQMIKNFPAIADPYRLGLIKPNAEQRNILRTIAKGNKDGNIDGGNLTEI